MVGGLIGFGIAKLAGLEMPGSSANLVMGGFLLSAFALSWWPYVRWARGKRLRAMKLVQEGELVEGRVATTTGDRVVQAAAKAAARLAGSGLGTVGWYRVVFEANSAQHFMLCPFPSRPEEGTPSAVLFHADSKYALGFDSSGRAFVGKVHRVGQ